MKIDWLDEWRVKLCFIRLRFHFHSVVMRAHEANHAINRRESRLYKRDFNRNGQIRVVSSPSSSIYLPALSK